MPGGVGAPRPTAKVDRRNGACLGLSKPIGGSNLILISDLRQSQERWRAVSPLFKAKREGLNQAAPFRTRFDFPLTKNHMLTKVSNKRGLTALLDRPGDK